MTDSNHQRFDPALYELLPHREPMLLINQIVSVDQSSATSIVFVDESAPFYEKNNGVPAWIGLEYMGQTAALIAGYQLKHGLVEPHLGFLLGTRDYQSHCHYFSEGKQLLVSCRERALVGDSLATFDCSLCYYEDPHQTNVANTELDVVASATLSVFRKAKAAMS